MYSCVNLVVYFKNINNSLSLLIPNLTFMLQSSIAFSGSRDPVTHKSPLIANASPHNLGPKLLPVLMLFTTWPVLKSHTFTELQDILGFWKHEEI